MQDNYLMALTNKKWSYQYARMFEIFMKDGEMIESEERGGEREREWAPKAFRVKNLERMNEPST